MPRSLIEIRARFARGLTLTSGEEARYRAMHLCEGFDDDRLTELRALVDLRLQEIEELALILHREGGYPRRAAERLALEETLECLHARAMLKVCRAVSGNLPEGVSLLQHLSGQSIRE